jgi:hypothetical protein
VARHKTKTKRFLKGLRGELTSIKKNMKQSWKPGRYK